MLTNDLPATSRPSKSSLFRVRMELGSAEKEEAREQIWWIGDKNHALLMLDRELAGGGLTRCESGGALGRLRGHVQEALYSGSVQMEDRSKI